MTVANFMSKAFSYQDLRSGGHYMPPNPDMMRQKYPEADTVKQLKVILKRCIAVI